MIGEVCLHPRPAQRSAGGVARGGIRGRFYSRCTIEASRSQRVGPGSRAPSASARAAWHQPPNRAAALFDPRGIDVRRRPSGRHGEVEQDCLRRVRAALSGRAPRSGDSTDREPPPLAPQLRATSWSLPSRERMREKLCWSGSRFWRSAASKRGRERSRVMASNAACAGSVEAVDAVSRSFKTSAASRAGAVADTAASAVRAAPWLGIARRVKPSPAASACRKILGEGSSAACAAAGLH